MPPNFAVTSDEELETAVRDKTSYNPGELPGTDTTGQMFGIIQDAKRLLFIKTGSQAWYTDTAYGHALVALTSMKAKEAVENIGIASYGIGDEQVSFQGDAPDDSAQFINWSNEMNAALDRSGIDFPDRENQSLRNTGAFIG